MGNSRTKKNIRRRINIIRINISNWHKPKYVRDGKIVCVLRRLTITQWCKYLGGVATICSVFKTVKLINPSLSFLLSIPLTELISNHTQSQ